MDANTLETLAPAKINWFLNIENQSKTGYHQLKTFMQKINLFDVIRCGVLKENRIEFKDINDKCACLPNENIVVQAAKKLKDFFGITAGIKIEIEKNIPVCAGLGGGSSDAAAVLNALVKLWEITISDKELKKIALSLGADVPFFLKGSAAFCEGIGELIKPVTANKFNIVLWNPKISLSTAQVYKQFDRKIREQRGAEKFLVAYSSCDLYKTAGEIWNNLAFAAEEILPELKKMKTECERSGAITSWVSGSGPTVISLCFNRFAARELCEKLRRRHPEHFINEYQTI